MPVLASADWSDHDLHLRGTIHGFRNVASTDTWLEAHAGGEFDGPDEVDLQRRFLDHHLKGADNGWRDQPRVQLAIRHVDGTTSELDAADWPVPDTRWQPFHLDVGHGALLVDPPDAGSRTAYEADGPGAVLETAELTEDTTVAGPVALWVSSSTADADLFLVLDAVDENGAVVELRDHRGGVTPMSVGWLRASHCAIDPERSTDWQPYHPHQASEPLVVGQPYELHVELRPTSLRVPAGYRLRLTITGTGRLHDDPVDRPRELFANTVTLHSGPGMDAYLLIPVVSQ